MNMMKFKSLFRRGQQSHSQQQLTRDLHQHQPTGYLHHQQMAQTELQHQASNLSTIEKKTDNSQADLWLANKGTVNVGSQKYTKSTMKRSKIQELERELELLHKERMKLEIHLQEVSANEEKLHELRKELSCLKVLEICHHFFFFFNLLASIN